MAEVKEIEDVYLEIEKGIIIAYHSDDIDENNLPSGHTIVFAQVEDPATLLGLPTRYITLDINDRPIQSTIPDKDILRAKLRSLSIDIDLAVRMKENIDDLTAQFQVLEVEYNNLNTPK